MRACACMWMRGQVHFACMRLNGKGQGQREKVFVVLFIELR